jgi:hypothetical protein
MRHILTNDILLDELGIKLDYWREKYNKSHPFFKNEYYQKYQEARKAFGDYYSKQYPKAAVKLKPPKKYTMIADLTERFEEYGD